MLKDLSIPTIKYRHDLGVQNIQLEMLQRSCKHLENVGGVYKEKARKRALKTTRHKT